LRISTIRDSRFHESPHVVAQPRRFHHLCGSAYRTTRNSDRGECRPSRSLSGGTGFAVENGLPLGITAETDYPEVSIQLPVGAQLTLYTDGVVEARARSGELFGFDRAAALSMQSAEVTAQTAQSFGQDDDITVLTVTLEASELASEAQSGLSWSATPVLERHGIQ
jgi:hypothetical protein